MVKVSMRCPANQRMVDLVYMGKENVWKVRDLLSGGVMWLLMFRWGADFYNYLLVFFVL